MLPKSASIFLVTANRLLRETLARVLSKKGGLDVCGASPCVPDIIDSIVASSATIVILDALSPNQPGGGLLVEIQRRSHSIKVVLIDMEEDPLVFLECTRAGAVGYFLKDASANEVLCGIRSVSNGHAVYPPQMCLPLLQTILPRSTIFPSARVQIELGLTRRQQQIVPLIAQGMTNKEIGSRLNLSEQTVKNHVHNMLKRAGVVNRLELIDATQKFRAFQPVSFAEMDAHHFSMAVSGRHILETA